MKRYIITDYENLDGVLDVFTYKADAKEIYYKCYIPQNRETHLYELKYDGRIYDYEWDDYKLNLFEKAESWKGWATPYLDKECLENRGITLTEIFNY